MFKGVEVPSRYTKLKAHVNKDIYQGLIVSISNRIETTKLIMTETAWIQGEKQRRELVVTKMMPCIPDDWNIQDGYSFLCILYDMGFFDNILDDTLFDKKKKLYKIYDFNVHSLAQTDSNGRITILRLYRNWRFNRNYDLPPAIERLQKLKEIAPGAKCLSIPMELNNLPHLERLDFQVVPMASTTYGLHIREGIQLAGIKRITFKLGANSSMRSMQMIFALLRNRLTNLESLCILGEDRKTLTNQILKNLQNDDFSFRQRLKTLKLTNFPLDEEDIETILFDILPRFPKLHKLDIGINEIKSLKSIESRIKRSRTALPENCLRELSHLNSGVRDLINDNPEEKAAFLTILNTFDGISSLQCCGYDINYERHECAPDVQYLLRINHAGRKYITGGPGGTEEEGTTAIATLLIATNLR